MAIDVEMLAQGKPDDTARLAQCLIDCDGATIIYTSETRGLKAIRIAERVLQLPAADVIIGDGGASVASTIEHPGIAELDDSFASRWIGTEIVRRRLRNITHLVGEHSYDAARRFSCFPRKGVSALEAKAAIERACAGIDLHIALSAGNRIDISPADVNTASTLTRVLTILGAQPAKTVVAGDAISEEMVAQRGCWGIVTGEIEPSVKASLVHHPRVLMTTAEGPNGILLGLQEFGVV